MFCGHSTGNRFMRALIVLAVKLSGAVVLSGCATLPGTRSTPYLPPMVFGMYQDNDIGAINFSAWAFASPANTQGNPAEAARAVVALEYLPGELSESPRWVGMDAATKLRMGFARDDVRRILGIRPDAPPQAVVNAMLAVMANLQFGNQAAALQVLAGPEFTQPAEQTLRALANLPYVQAANLATSRAEGQSFPGDGAAMR
jgi:hypothetical protein